MHQTGIYILTMQLSYHMFQPLNSLMHCPYLAPYRHIYFNYALELSHNMFEPVNSLLHSPLSGRTGACKLLLLIAFLSGCINKKPPRVVERSFYYWKSSFKPGGLEENTLTKLHVNLLYVKFFDITWNEERNEPMPMAIIKFPQKHEYPAYVIIPTVFITNECMQKMTGMEVKALATRVLSLVKNIALANSITAIPEIQMDCDWSAGTKDNYFLLLQTIKDLLAGEKKRLSVTIRLHQYKYYKRMGIPPADRGLLMCYNMGNLKSFYTRNSILEAEELEKYLNGGSGYLLPLDVGLPLFCWKVLFRNKNYTGLIRELPGLFLQNNPLIKRSGNRYEFLQATSIDGYSFQQGDILRDEEIPYDELLKATDILHGKLKTQQLRVVLYHLDSITLSKYSLHELETIFGHLR